MSKDKEVEGFSFTDVFNQKSECDRENDLYRYFEGRLSADDEKSFEKHIAVCDYCGRRLSELQREDRAIQDTVLDPEQAKQIFDQNRTRLRGALDVKYSSAQLGGSSFLHAFKLPTYANALMMLLLAVLIYPAYRSFVLDRELDRARAELASERSTQHPEQITQAYENEIKGLREEQRKLTEPALSGSAVYSARTERAGQRQTITVDFARNRSFNLVFALPPADFKTYVVEILQDSTTVWRKETTVDPANALISVYLQADYLKAGEYTLRIAGVKGQTSSVIAEYKLRIEPQRR